MDFDCIQTRTFVTCETSQLHSSEKGALIITLHENIYHTHTWALRKLTKIHGLIQIEHANQGNLKTCE